MWLTMDFIVALLLFDSDGKYFTFVFLNFLFRAFPTAFYLFFFLFLTYVSLL